MKKTLVALAAIMLSSQAHALSVTVGDGGSVDIAEEVVEQVEAAVKAVEQNESSTATVVETPTVEEDPFVLNTEGVVDPEKVDPNAPVVELPEDPAVIAAREAAAAAEAEAARLAEIVDIDGIEITTGLAEAIEALPDDFIEDVAAAIDDGDIGLDQALDALEEATAKGIDPTQFESAAEACAGGIDAAC